MKFYEYESDWSYHKGEWCESQDDCPTGFDSGDCELYEMSLEPDDTTDDEDAFVFDYWDWHDPKASWFCNIRIPEGERFGTPERPAFTVYVDGELAGYVYLDGGNECENVLLGIYDVIERWFNDRKVA